MMDRDWEAKMSAVEEIEFSKSLEQIKSACLEETLKTQDYIRRLMMPLVLNSYVNQPKESDLLFVKNFYADLTSPFWANKPIEMDSNQLSFDFGAEKSSIAADTLSTTTPAQSTPNDSKQLSFDFGIKKGSVGVMNIVDYPQICKRPQGPQGPGQHQNFTNSSIGKTGSIGPGQSVIGKEWDTFLMKDIVGIKVLPIKKESIFKPLSLDDQNIAEYNIAEYNIKKDRTEYGTEYSVNSFAKEASVMDGKNCIRCKNFFPMAESNQKDGSMICYSCRTGY